MNKISDARLLRSILETFDGYIYICSPDYRIQYMNSRFIERTGSDTGDKLCYAALHNLDRPCPWCPNDSVFSGETIQWELKSPRDGHWYKIIDTPITDDEGNPLKLALIEDISGYKDTEEKLFREQERYHTIVDDQTELICRFSTDMTLTFVNSSYCLYFEKTADELTGSSFAPLIPEEDLPLVRKCVDTLTYENPSGTVEHRAIMPDGTLRWHHWTNRAIFDTGRKIIEYQAVGQDITKMKEREVSAYRLKKQLETQIEEKTAGLSQVIEWLNENIRQKEEISDRFQLLCNALNRVKSITIITDSSGTVEIVNDTFIKKTGFSRNEIIKSSLRTYTGFNIDEVKNIRDTILKGERWNGPCFFHKKEGPEFNEDIEITGITLKSGDSGKLFFIITGS